MFFKSTVLFLLAVLSAGLVKADPSPEAKATVVIYNAAQSSSKDLAEFYAKGREIPADNLIGVPCSAQEEISREEYNTTIATPIRKIFQSRGWWQMTGSTVTATKVRFVVLMRGMPLKVHAVPRPAGDNSPAKPLERDEASVDSELACLGMNIPSIAGPIQNPYVNRNMPILDALVDPGLLLVCRLDAPTDIMVRVMIGDTLMAEKTGLWGWAYVDARGLTSGPYEEGDQWLKNDVMEMRAQGIPVLWDQSPATLQSGYPVTDAAIYYGWYAAWASGPFRDFGMRFRPGAVAVHIQSFTASTLRDPLANWCAPLINSGAAATVGNVYEPGLTLTAHLDILQDRLMAGYTFAESAYMSLIALSWMNVSIGDPLYRPYAAWQQATDQDANPWSLYRQIVRAAGGVTSAAPELLRAAQKTGNTLFLESLAATQSDAGDLSGALKTLNVAISMEKRPLVLFRLNWEKFGILQSTGAKAEAKALLTRELLAPPTSFQKTLLEQTLDHYYPTPAPSISPR